MLVISVVNDQLSIIIYQLSIVSECVVNA